MKKNLIIIIGLTIGLFGCKTTGEIPTEPPQPTGTTFASLATATSVVELPTPTSTMISVEPTPTSPSTPTSESDTATPLIVVTEDVATSTPAKREARLDTTAAPRSKTTPESAEAFPLNDMDGMTYLGFVGGLYPDGSNEMPAQHAKVGLDRARMIQPLNQEGNPDPNGKYVLLSVGMSNTSMEFCGTRQARVACNPGSFIGRLEQDAAVNNTHLVVIDGARGGQVATKWELPTDENYDRVSNQLFPIFGVSEKQVQIIWLKVANPAPRFSLPIQKADAYRLLSSMANILRALKVRYPNLQQVFISSRIYAGYANRPLNPEPYAYESGLAVKWLIEAQIKQMEGKSIDLDPRIIGDLNYDTAAPWIAWGPYLWAKGSDPRSDGLTWTLEDFAEDGTHPSDLGKAKVGAMLLDFFKTSSQTSCWFLAGSECR